MADSTECMRDRSPGHFEAPGSGTSRTSMRGGENIFQALSGMPSASTTLSTQKPGRYVAANTLLSLIDELLNLGVDGHHIQGQRDPVVVFAHIAEAAHPKCAMCICWVGERLVGPTERSSLQLVPASNRQDTPARRRDDNVDGECGVAWPAGRRMVSTPSIPGRFSGPEGTKSGRSLLAMAMPCRPSFRPRAHHAADLAEYQLERAAHGGVMVICRIVCVIALVSFQRVYFGLNASRKRRPDSGKLSVLGRFPPTSCIRCLGYRQTQTRAFANRAWW